MKAALWAVALAVIAQPALAQNDAPLIDNARVTVRKIALMPGQPLVLQTHDSDFVILVLEGGKFHTTMDGKQSVATYKFGDALFARKGTIRTEELLSGGPATLVGVMLKERREPLPANTSGYPAAFPRPGAKNTLDNDRVAAWTFTWTPGVSTPMHYHAADIVGVFRYAGQVRSTPPDGKVTVTDYKAGEVRYTKGDRVHSETLTGGRESAILMEIK